MLNAIVHREFGEKVTERIAAQACIKMAEKSRQELQALQTPETRAALGKIRPAQSSRVWRSLQGMFHAHRARGATPTLLWELRGGSSALRAMVRQRPS